MDHRVDILLLDCIALLPKIILGKNTFGENVLNEFLSRNDMCKSIPFGVQYGFVKKIIPQRRFDHAEVL
jgi:hypothetical protein